MKLLSISISVLLFSCTNSSERANPGNTARTGAQIFTTTCSPCHKCDADLTGPAMKGALSRWKSKELLYEYIRNPQSVIEKDPYAKSLQKRFTVTMPPFTTLTDKEIDDVLNYSGT
jgi:cytochrome c